MTNKPFVSVIMANFNGSSFLREAIESVLCQSYESFEFIIVDDGSGDESKAIISSYDKEHEQINFIDSMKNEGQGASFNKAIQQARGELISFIDSDDLWLCTKLEKTVELYIKYPKAAVFGHDLWVMDGALKTQEKFRNIAITGDYYAYCLRNQAMPSFIPTTGLSFPKRILDEVGAIPIDFKTCADGYLTRTSFCFGDVRESNEALGYYRVHGKNATIGNNSYDTGRYLMTLLYPNLSIFYQEKGLKFWRDVPPDYLGVIVDYALEFNKEKIDKDRVAIYGASITGKTLKWHLEKKGIKVNYFIDQSFESLGDVSGLPVFSPEILNSEKKPSTLFIASPGGETQIKKRLSGDFPQVKNIITLFNVNS